MEPKKKALISVDWIFKRLVLHCLGKVAVDVPLQDPAFTGECEKQFSGICHSEAKDEIKTGKAECLTILSFP